MIKRNLTSGLENRALLRPFFLHFFVFHGLVTRDHSLFRPFVGVENHSQPYPMMRTRISGFLKLRNVPSHRNLIWGFEIFLSAVSVGLSQIWAHGVNLLRNWPEFRKIMSTSQAPTRAYRFRSARRFQRGNVPPSMAVVKASNKHESRKFDRAPNWPFTSALTLRYVDVHQRLEWRLACCVVSATRDFLAAATSDRTCCW